MAGTVVEGEAASSRAQWGAVMGMFDDLIPNAAKAGNLYRRKPSLLSDVDVGLTPPAEMFDDPTRNRPQRFDFSDGVMCLVQTHRRSAPTAGA